MNNKELNKEIAKLKRNVIEELKFINTYSLKNNCNKITRRTPFLYLLRGSLRH